MNELVKLTSKAINEIEAIQLRDKTEKSFGLRLSVVGGGCSGLSYKMEFTAIKEKDNIQEYNKFKVIVDPKSAIYLKGITLDFKDGLNGKGFVFENPNAKNTCGCGESFTI